MSVTWADWVHSMGLCRVTAATDEVEVLESVPQRAHAQRHQSFQVPPLLCGSFCTVAMKLWERVTGPVLHNRTDVDGSLRRAGTIVMFALATAVESATDCDSQCGCWRMGTCGSAV